MPPTAPTDLTEVIAAAVEDASTAEPTIVESVEPVVASTETTPAAVVPAVVSPSAAAAAPVAEPAAPAKDAVETELEALGILPPVEGQRENRLPYTRVKKIVETAQRKLTTAHQTALKTYADKTAAIEAEVTSYRNADKVASEDPDRYIQSLARVDPRYQKFLTPTTAVPATVAAAPVVVPAANDPMPEPDAQFPDGTRGYSLEGLAARDKWHARQIERTITDSVTKRFGPMEEKWKAEQAIQASLPKVRQQISTAKEVWGDLFTKYEAEVLTALNADKVSPFELVVSRVLLPKLRVDRDAMRQDLLKEMDKRPAAAASGAPAAVAVATPSGPKTTEDTIREAIAASGLKR